MDQQYKDLAGYVEKVKEVSESIVKNIDEKMAEMKEREEKWKKLEKQMDENSSKVKSKIILDVGGKRFATSKDTLLLQKDTYFSAMLQSGRFKPEEDGTYFIDRSPKYFALILEFLRTGKLSTAHLNAEQLDALKLEFDYYQMHLKEGSILAGSKIIDGINLSFIEKYAKKKIGALLWRGSEHEFNPQSFHSSCDNHGSTLVISKSNKNVFGGYADVSWISNGVTGGSSSFLFTLINPYNIPPTIYPHTKPKAFRSRGTTSLFDADEVGSANVGVLFGNAQCGPAFGHSAYGFDMTFLSQGRGCSFQFPKLFQDLTGQGKRTFTGSSQCNLDEIEVFRMCEIV